MTDCNADFETKSGTDIKLGLPRYFADPEADVLVLRYRLPGGDIQRWKPGDPPPEDLFEHVRLGHRVRGWNVMFEWHVWNFLCCAKYGWPELPMDQLVDTMAEAAAMNLPQALDKCGEAMGLPINKLKSKHGKALIRKLCVPQKLTKNHQLRWLTPQTHPQLHAELDDYCGQDVVAEESIAKKLRRLSEWEQRVWLTTQVVNQRGVPVAVDEVRNITGIVTAETERLNQQLRKITGRQVLKATNRAAMLRWINAHSGINPVYFDDPLEEDAELMRDVKGETVDKVLERTDLPEDVRRVLEIRQLVVQTSTAKFPKLLKIVAADRTLKGMHTYHGAGTGRWASRGGFNVQNLTRPTLGNLDIETAHELLGYDTHDDCATLFGDDVMNAAVCCLRGIIAAPEGMEFIDADYSSVENRVAAWIAGQDDKLAMFAAGLDEYKTFASRRLFKCHYDEVTKQQRQDTKPVILGGIFGLGAAGLVDYSKKYGVSMTLDYAGECIKALRADYDKIEQCWWDCGNAAIAAVQNPGKWFAVGTKLSLICYKNMLWMKLPSGRPIAWSRPRVEMTLAPWFENVQTGWDEFGEPIFEKQQARRPGVTVESVDTYTRQWCRHKLIGSSIFQSAVQATARDILANGLVNVEEAGYSVVLMVHDELMALMPEGWGDPEEFGRLMCKPAEWFKDLPLAYEAWRGRRFRK